MGFIWLSTNVSLSARESSLPLSPTHPHSSIHPPTHTHPPTTHTHPPTYTHIPNLANGHHVSGKGASLIGADDRGAAQCLHGGEAAHDGILTSHATGTCKHMCMFGGHVEHSSLNSNVQMVHVQSNEGRKFSGFTCQNALQTHCTITWFQTMSIEQPRSVTSDSYVYYM